jgi:hypothetical protein
MGKKIKGLEVNTHFTIVFSPSHLISSPLPTPLPPSQLHTIALKEKVDLPFS